MRAEKVREVVFPEARILILDDQPVNVKVLERLLSKIGYQNVNGMTDPRDLFDRTQDNDLDLLLLDIHMPHIDGTEVIRRLRAGEDGGRRGRLPILVLTADVSEDVKLMALEAGADDFLTKPFDVSEVVLRVHNLLAIHVAYLQLREYSGEHEARVDDRTTRLLEALDNLGKSREQALWIVGLTLEYRDFETKGHTDRVTRLALAAGKQLGLDEDELRDLRWSSYLHDTGKIAIADGILLKPGKLTSKERTRIEQHVVIGEDMLAKLEFLPQRVLEVVRHHHERWDGRGYPDRLAGDAIPRLARIFSVVDVYDALTSERPYKQAWTKEAALTEIEAQTGKQFDPQVVAAFLDVVTS
jgi:putative two-component system response regulator